MSRRCNFNNTCFTNNNNKCSRIRCSNSRMRLSKKMNRMRPKILWCSLSSPRISKRKEQRKGEGVLEKRIRTLRNSKLVISRCKVKIMMRKTLIPICYSNWSCSNRWIFNSIKEECLKRKRHLSLRKRKLQYQGPINQHLGLHNCHSVKLFQLKLWKFCNQQHQLAPISNLFRPTGVRVRKRRRRVQRKARWTS